ncbi:MAG: DUF4129 domain-containing protein [Candidatus Eremiobacter antarcticus]|nr:DUF4129 domain-containing protein [Candidatus Eremiobacteraeota bacterium]MBC5807348.1 DUF4129 domain-containing protein [Candidatus Eremiobacteraeota bacterium]
MPAAHLPAGAHARGFTADHWLQACLRAIAAQKNRRLQAQSLTLLTASVRRLDSGGPASAAPRSPPKDAVALILGQKPYRDAVGSGPAPPPARSLLERFLDWLGRLLAKVLGAVFRGASSVPLFGELIAGAFVLALLAAAVYVTAGLLRSVRTRRGRQHTALGAVLAAPIDADDLYRRGLAHAARGEYAEAIAALFKASLACLDRGGAIAYDASRTAGEYRRLVMRVLRPASSHFDALAAIFSFIAYAERTPSEQDWSEARAAFLALRPLIAS